NDASGGETDAGLNRIQEAHPQDWKRAHEIIHELAEPTLAPAVAMVQRVFLFEQPGMHPAVDPVFDQRSGHESDQEGHETNEHRTPSVSMHLSARAIWPAQPNMPVQSARRILAEG